MPKRAKTIEREERRKMQLTYARGDRFFPPWTKSELAQCQMNLPNCAIEIQFLGLEEEMSKEKTAGQIAYEAYCLSMTFVPFWGLQTDRVQKAWEDAARAVAKVKEE